MLYSSAFFSRLKQDKRKERQTQLIDNKKQYRSANRRIIEEIGYGKGFVRIKKRFQRAY